LYKEAEHRLSRDGGGLIRSAHPSISISTLYRRCLDNSLPATPQSGKSELGIGPDISVLLDEGELDLAIVSNEIGEGDGARYAESGASGRPDGRCSSNRNSRRRSHYILHTAGGGSWRWRNSIGPAGRGRSCFISAGTTGILAALDAGLAIMIFPEFNLPHSLKSLGAEELPALPDFEFVLRRGRNSSLAADHLAEMIINFFQLSTALRPGNEMNYKERSHLFLRTGLEA
jgi:DNA-binding transcriptional LysR family regulator